MKMKVIQLDKAVLYVSDVASLLGCCSYRIYTAIKRKELCANKTGKAYIISIEAFEDYVKKITSNKD